MNNPTRSRLGAAAVLLGGAFLVAGCAGDDRTAETDPTEPAAGAEVDQPDLRIAALDIEFDEDRYQTDPGPLTIAYRQEGAVRHTLVIERSNGGDIAGFKLEVDDSTPEDTASVTLEPGGYVLYCDVPGHRQAGMEADLVVSETSES